MRNTYKPWTDEEIEQVKLLGKSSETKKISEIIGRSEKSIASMLRRKGFTLMSLRAWTEDEDTVIRLRGHEMTAAELAAVFGRKEEPVKRRAAFLRVSMKKVGEHHHAAKYSNELRAKYLEMIDAGNPKQTSAKLLKIHPATASGWERVRNQKAARAAGSSEG